MRGPEITIGDIPELTRRGEEQPLRWIAENLGVGAAVAISRKYGNQTINILSYRTLSANANNREIGYPIPGHE